jgi:hypothetical protein
MYLDDNPIIIIEDDVECFTELNSETEIDIPEDTDAFYLGFSKFAGHKTLNYHDGSSQIEKISDKHIRILNMLSTHAILYKTKSYKQRVIEEFEKVVDKSYYNDIIISRIQAEYKIYAYHYPLFYQSVKFQNNKYIKSNQEVENCTKYTYEK